MMSKTRGPLPPVILLAFLLLQLGLHLWLPVARVLSAPWTYAGIALIVAGLSVVVVPATAFKRADTTVIPFKESSALLTGGMYRLTRNPMYVGMVAILLGVALLCGTLSPFVAPVLFVPILNVRVIRHEEAMLEDRFGQDYRDYKRRVRRWV